MRDGWNDQEIADLIIASRRANGDDLKLRIDYYRRTIEKARSNIRKEEARDTLNELALDTDGTVGFLAPADRRKMILDNLNIAFGIEIKRIIKHQSVPEPAYQLETSLGSIALPSVAYLLDQSKFRAKAASVTGRVLPQFETSQWNRLAELLLDCCEADQDRSAKTGDRQMASWITTYLAEKNVEDKGRGPARSEAPFADGGKICLFSTDLQRWIAATYGEHLTARHMAEMMRILGAKSVVINIYSGNERTTRSMWQVPLVVLKGWQDGDGASGR